MLSRSAREPYPVRPSLKTQEESKLIKLVPFGLSWPIFGYLKAATDQVSKENTEFRFLLVLSEFEESAAESTEVRYSMLRSLHDQLQGMPVDFSIETAVGPLAETAVAYASDCHATEIILANFEQPTELFTDPIFKTAPCKTTLLQLN